MYQLNQKGRIDLIPTCRALEADIVCEFFIFEKVLGRQLI
jgi:hypothetical protein